MWNPNQDVSDFTFNFIKLASVHTLKPQPNDSAYRSILITLPSAVNDNHYIDNETSDETSRVLE